MERDGDQGPLPVPGSAKRRLRERPALSSGLRSTERPCFVADQQTQHEALFRAGKFKDTRAALTQRLARKPNYDLVLDKPLWVDTALSSWDREIIQLADIAAYSVNECLKRGTTPHESVYLWQQIRTCMAAHFTTGAASGAGLSIYPNSAALPDVE